MVQIVAEISGNHGGDLHKAKEMIWEASHCDCDFAKFQFYRPEDMPDRHLGDNDAMYRKLMVHEWWLPELYETAKCANIGLFASVFSIEGAKTLLKFDPPFIKIASPGSTRLSKGCYLTISQLSTPVNRLIVSSGRTDWREMGWLGGLMMYCPPGHPQVLTSDDLAFGCTCWGFSDHSAGTAAPLAMLKGSSIQMLEKHFKVDEDCIDAEFSADPDTMATLCRIVHHL